jgi:antirestriction protein ArdC
MPTTDHSDLLAQLAEGIARLTTSDAWREHLLFQSRFHRYSYSNVVLISSQDPRATQVAGFRTWCRLDRFVRKGEKALWILAPIVRRRKDPGNDDDDDARGIRGFKYVPVFDIAQTDGKTPPAVCTRLNGDDPAGIYPRLVTVARSIGFSVEDCEFDATTNGDCSHSERRIRVEVRNEPVQRVKTLAHELAHALLHQCVNDRALAELEAESTAYVVCQGLGLDTAGYSFGYVAIWAGGGEQAIASIKASCGRIQKAAASILQPFADGDSRAA